MLSLPIEDLNEEIARMPRRLRWYVAGALAGAGAAVGVLLYALSHFAHADEVRSVADRTSAVGLRLSAAELEAAAQAATLRRMEEELRFNRNQLWEIAKAVGARKLEAPARDGR